MNVPAPIQEPFDAAGFREEYLALAERIRVTMQTQVRAGPPQEDSFEALALDIFRFQCAHNPAYSNFCRSLNHGRLPEPGTWSEIPSVPAEAFKLAEIPVACFPPEQAQACFQTSGTTAGARGKHYFYSTDLYRDSVLLGWRELGLPELPTMILTPSPLDAPQSSLSFMMGVLAETWSPEEESFLVNAGGELDVAALEARCAEGSPFLLLGTALSFLHLCELPGQAPALRLPAGSFVLETGGYKGTGRALEKSALYSLMQNRLGVDPENIINEYGMTELSSQFYTVGPGKENQTHRGPHWVRARVRNPESGEPAEEGEAGFLEIFDLANLGSVAALSTRDLAVRRDGNSFELLGRDPRATPRGCSLSAGAFQDAQQS